MTKLITGLDK